MGLVNFSRVQMDSDKDVALGLFERSLKQCAKVGIEEGVLQTKEAIRRLRRAQETKV